MTPAAVTAPARVDLAELRELVDAALEATRRLPHWAPPLTETQHLMDALRAQAHALAAEVRALLDAQPTVTLDRGLAEWLLTRLEGHARTTVETAASATARGEALDAWLVDVLDEHAADTAVTALEAADALERLALDTRALASLYERHRPDPSAT